MPSNALPKWPSDSRLYTLDLTQLLDFGEVVSAIVSVTPDDPGITVSGPQINGSPIVINDPKLGTVLDTIAAGKSVQFRSAGGTAGSTYTVSVKATTSNGNSIEEDIRFFIKE